MPIQEEQLKNVLGEYQVTKKHDDGDLSITADGLRYVATTEGDIFRECGEMPSEGCKHYTKNLMDLNDRVHRDWMDFRTDEAFSKQLSAKMDSAVSHGYLTKEQGESIKSVPIGRAGIAFTLLLESIVENILSCDCVCRPPHE